MCSGYLLRIAWISLNIRAPKRLLKIHLQKARLFPVFCLTIPWIHAQIRRQTYISISHRVICFVGKWDLGDHRSRLYTSSYVSPCNCCVPQCANTPRPQLFSWGACCWLAGMEVELWWQRCAWRSTWKSWRLCSCPRSHGMGQDLAGSFEWAKCDVKSRMHTWSLHCILYCIVWYK